MDFQRLLPRMRSEDMSKLVLPREGGGGKGGNELILIKFHFSAIKTTKERHFLKPIYVFFFIQGSLILSKNNFHYFVLFYKAVLQS